MLLAPPPREQRFEAINLVILWYYIFQPFFLKKKKKCLIKFIQAHKAVRERKKKREDFKNSNSVLDLFIRILTTISSFRLSRLVFLFLYNIHLVIYNSRKILRKFAHFMPHKLAAQRKEEVKGKGGEGVENQFE